MNDSKVIYSVLEEVLPLESDIAGVSNVEDIAEAALNKNLEFTNIEGGAWIDLDTAITLLTSAAGLAAQVIQLYREWKAEKKSEPKPDDIKNEIEDATKTQLGEDLVEKISNAVLKQLKSEKEEQGDK